MRVPIWNCIAYSAALFVALPLVAAHGNNEGHMASSEVAPVDPDSSWERSHRMPSYFRHPEHSSWNLTHTILMLLAWFVLMPVAIMLSSGRSKYHLPAQIVFHIFNGIGVFAGFVYNHSTPNLYENNSHHPLGWIVTGFAIAWTIMSFYVAYSEHQSKSRLSSGSGTGLSAQVLSQYERLQQQYVDQYSPRDSRDSGQGTERNSASLFGSRQNSTEHITKPEVPLDDINFEHDDHEDQPENRGFLGKNRIDRFVSRSVRRVSSRPVTNAARFGQIVLEKLLLLLGFAALASGFIVSGGLFRDRQVFSGLAHYIKGGIFFWYGLLTLGRWMGAFAEFGWAWNVRPSYPLVAKWKTRVPSAEFTESFVIWLYGASNVFLEHLNSWGKEWSPSDLEHLSITILFFGGGLLGMLIESSWVRKMMNTGVVVQKSEDEQHAGASRFPIRHTGEELEYSWEEPRTYKVSMNPMPATVIMMLGMMMGAHHQKSMVSTMLHAQWGGLFTAFALARGVTYITMYLRPPMSHFSSRPPSELVAAFCLTSGGFIFMNSASDIVWAIESNGLDAMYIFTVSLGLTGIVLSWEVLTFAIKGWSIRKEKAAAGKILEM